MPIYEYEYLEGTGPNGEKVIEIVQHMSEEPLTVCPYTGNPIRRIISAPARHSAASKIPNNKRLGELGFTKYEKKGDGYWERTAGDKGPSTLHRPPGDE